MRQNLPFDVYVQRHFGVSSKSLIEAIINGTFCIKFATGPHRKNALAFLQKYALSHGFQLDG